MPEKLGNGGAGPEKYNPETGQYVAAASSSSGDIKSLGLKITGKGDLEAASQKIIEAKKSEFINKMKNLIGFEKLKEININPKKTQKEILDDSQGIDYYLVTEGDKVVYGMDDKTGVNTKDFAFEIFKNINGKDVTAWFTNPKKRNVLISFGSLEVDDENNVTGCEYNLFDSSCAADCVYNCLGIMDPNVNPDNYLYDLGREMAKNAKFGKKNEVKLDYKKNGRTVDGAYVKIKSKPGKKGPTISVSLLIDKDKIRSMCEEDEYQFLKF